MAYVVSYLWRIRKKVRQDMVVAPLSGAVVVREDGALLADKLTPLALSGIAKLQSFTPRALYDLVVNDMVYRIADGLKELHVTLRHQIISLVSET